MSASFKQSALLAACLSLFGCITINSSEPIVAHSDLDKTKAAIQAWVVKEFPQKEGMFADAVTSHYVAEGVDRGRIELMWTNKGNTFPFARIRLRQIAPSEVEIMVYERKIDMLLTNKYQNVGSRLRTEVERPGFASQ